MGDAARVPFGIDPRDSLAIAQHYGIGTTLIDWTWDPFVALAFAIQGIHARKTYEDVAVVAIRRLSKDLKDQVILPPTAARRVWKQAGLFQRHSCPAEALIDPSFAALGIQHLVVARGLVESYPRITFPVDPSSGEWAANKYEEMMSDESPFPQLVRWSYQAAEHLDDEVETTLGLFPMEFERVLASSGLPKPLPLETGAPHVSEDLESVQPYAEKVALRSRGGQIGVDQGALAIFCDGVGRGCSLCWASDGEPGLETNWVSRFLRDIEYPSRLRRDVWMARIRERYSGTTTRPWYEDEWQGVDLYLALDSPESW